MKNLHTRIIEACLRRSHSNYSSGCCILLAVLCFSTNIPLGAVAKVIDSESCYAGFFLNITTGTCETCHKCPPGTQPHEACTGLTRSQPRCERCPSGTYSDKWSYDMCELHTLCSWFGRKTIRLGNALNDTVCDSKCLPGHFKPRGVESLCLNCTRNKDEAPCVKWFEDQKAAPLPVPLDSNVSSTSSPLIPGSVGDGLTKPKEPIDRKGGNNTSQSLGLVAVVVSVSIVLSVLLVALILCCFCRINSAAGAGSRRRRGTRPGAGAANAHHSHTLAGTNSTHSNRSSSAAGMGCCKKTSNDLDSTSVDQCSISDYESHNFLCCFNGRFSRCSSLKRREDNQSSNGNYCIKDSSFVFKNGKSLENPVDFQYHQYQICNEASTLNNPPYSQSPYSYEPLKKSSSMEMKSKNMIEDSGSPLGGPTAAALCQKELPPAPTQASPPSGGGTGQPGSHDYAPLPQNQQQTLMNNNNENTTTTFGAVDDYNANQTVQHLVNNPTADTRLTRQNSVKNREKQQKLATAQENAYKLRHVSPRRLRSASETIFGTSDGKETILDLLQSREPEEILALKIELISQMYENLKLNELSPDIIKEMTTEMERLPQHVSLNLGRAFIDTYNLTIKAKTITCAQLLVKTFKHRGAQIEVSQFLQFLHQFGDRKVAESFCDLLISWYRHETMQHKNRLLNSRTAQQQQQITPSAVVAALNNSFQQMAPQQPSSQTVTPLPHRHQQVSPLGTVGIGAPGNPLYGASVPAHLRTPVLRHSASIPASTTMATNFYQAPSGPQMSQQPTGPHFVQSNNASAAMTAMAATNKYFNNNSINNNQTAATQSPLMNHAYNAQSMQQQAPSLPISTVPETPPNMQHLINYAQMPTLNVHKRPVQEENSSEVGEDDVFD